MNTPTAQATKFRPKLGKGAIVIALASAIAGFGITPAFGDEHDNDGHGAKNHSHKATTRHNYRPQTQHPAYYARTPLYYNAPSQVYYAPQPSPGISLFIPIDIR